MSSESLQQAGPLLAALMRAQDVEAEVVTHRLIEAVADHVIERARVISGCVLWPVGAAAERVAGVVTARSKGAVSVGAWDTDVSEARLLVFVVAAVSPLELLSTAARLRRRGAAEVHGCGIDIVGAENAVGLDSYASLERSFRRRPASNFLGTAA